MADSNPSRSEPQDPETSETEHDRGDDEAVRGSERSSDEEFEDIDPDSARSDVDRDDTIDEP
jgi:hypothetical protein